MTGVQQTGERVEALIAELRGSADPAAAAAGSALARSAAISASTRSPVC